MATSVGIFLKVNWPNWQI